MVQREAPEHRHHLGQLEVGGGAEHEPPQQRGRARQLGRGSAGHEPGPTLRDRHSPAVDQRLRHLAGEEGIAPAGPDHRVGQPVVELGPDHRGGERPGVGPVERLEVDDRPPTLECHPLAELLELRGTPAGPQGHHGEDGQAGEPDQQRSQRQRLAVGHVDVLEDEDQRSPVRQGPEQPGGRREHLGQVLGVGLGDVALDGGAQPARRVRARVQRAEAGEEVTEGGERDAVVEVVGAADDHGVTQPAGLVRQLGDQARLPHAGLAADEERGRGPACAARQLLPGDRQVEVAPDQRRRAHRRHCPPSAGSVGRPHAAGPRPPSTSDGGSDETTAGSASHRRPWRGNGCRCEVLEAMVFGPRK